MMTSDEEEEGSICVGVNLHEGHFEVEEEIDWEINSEVSHHLVVQFNEGIKEESGIDGGERSKKKAIKILATKMERRTTARMTSIVDLAFRERELRRG
jgi:hypothetical protein